ncbi:MAG TPA: glycosyltransferase family 1 protein [Sphingomonas sp.]
MSDLSVGIDGYNLAMPHGTGVATYGFALTETLRAMGRQTLGVFGVPVGMRPELREILFYEAMVREATPSKLPAPLRYAAQRIGGYRTARGHEVPDTGLVERRYFRSRLPRFDRIVSAANLFERADRHFARTWRFTRLVVPDPPAVMHWTYPVPIRLEGARNVYTLHDLVPLKLPYATLDRKRSYYRLVERCVREGDHICTVSESSRRDIADLFAVDPDRITNTYQTAPSLPQGFDRTRVDADVASLFGLKPRGYLLYFGAIEPKKNVARMVEAHLSSQLDMPLVLVGARAWQSEGDLQLVTSGLAASGSAFGRRVADRVVRLDYLPRSLLLQLVSGARAVVFPSLYEGFGLPVLEAMQLGTPVLTANTGSLPEVAGNAAALVDPYDTRAIADAMVRLGRDDAWCAELARRGFAQAANFTPDRYRERLDGMYDAVLRRPRR